jgi:transketolase
MALGAEMTGGDWQTFCVMSDGEQHKGQVAEARRVAVREELAELTAVLDWNRVQISGHTDEVMPVPIKQDWEADGWRVYECDGHDIAALHDALRAAAADGVPSVVLAHTVIGKGVSFMEDVPEFHGRGLTRDEYVRAMAELGCDSGRLEAASALRGQPCVVVPLDHLTPAVPVVAGAARTYTSDTKTDNRSAWGKALVDVARANPGLAVTVLDCDLAVSVKTDGFAAEFPERFHQFGVGEHNAATTAGALSTVPGVLALWSDFGAFGVDEVYNQQRLNDINGAALKLAVTHCGLDVGEDGKTHQCLDYVGALRNFFGWKVIVPADPNQTDRAVRAACAMQGNVAIAMGRSKLDVLLAEDGAPLLGDATEFEYGRIVWARHGAHGCVLALGALAGPAVAASDTLRTEGISVAVGVVSCPLDLDEEAMRVASAAPFVMTVEDHHVRTGLGASVAEWLALNGAPTRFVRAGVDGYQSSGAAGDLFAAARLDAAGIAERLREVLAES